MSSTIPDISALLCIRTNTPAAQTVELTEWTVEYDDPPANSIKQAYSLFNPQTGVYTTPKDGIYMVEVQLIPIGGAILQNHRQTRKQVNYAVHIQEPLAYNEYVDIGGHNLGHMTHIRAGTSISCVRMAGANDQDCLRLIIRCLQLKKKGHKVVLSKKEIKRRKRAKRRARRVDLEGSDDSAEESSESSWIHGFESDYTND